MTNTIRIFTALLITTMILMASSCFNNNPANDPVHKCESCCSTCGKCTDKDCTEDACKDKCDGGHINLPDINVGDLK